MFRAYVWCQRKEGSQVSRITGRRDLKYRKNRRKSEREKTVCVHLACVLRRLNFPEQWGQALAFNILGKSMQTECERTPSIKRRTRFFSLVAWERVNFLLKRQKYGQKIKLSFHQEVIRWNLYASLKVCRRFRGGGWVVWNVIRFQRCSDSICPRAPSRKGNVRQQIEWGSTSSLLYKSTLDERMKLQRFMKNKPNRSQEVRFHLYLGLYRAEHAQTLYDGVNNEMFALLSFLFAITLITSPQDSSVTDRFLSPRAVRRASGLDLWSGV